MRCASCGGAAHPASGCQYEAVGAPIRVDAGILGILDELGVPHCETPRQGFLVTVSPEPPPPMPSKSFLEILDETFGVVGSKDG